MTLHEITSLAEGAGFISIGPVTAVRQMRPKIAKNDRPFSTVFLKNGAGDIAMQLWDDASKWKLPLDVPLMLRGKFSKSNYGGCSIRSEELSEPEGATLFGPEDVEAKKDKPNVRAAIDAGIRAADYLVKNKRPELAPSAFRFAAQAFLDGHSLE